jgi:resuscitation-promoting factor RpfB
MRTPSFPRQLRRALLPVGTLLSLGALAATLYSFSSSVQVTVDGEAHDVRTFASTVGGVLDVLDIELGPADEVTPEPATSLDDGLHIAIDRAITVEVEIDGAVARRVTAPVGSVAGVLAIAGMDDLDDRGATVEPALGTPVEDGDVVSVSFPVAVTVTVDGEEHEIDTFADDVDEVLDDVGVEVGDDDIVLPGPGSVLLGPTNIVVQRVETEEVTEDVTLAHDEVRRETKDLRKGRTSVDRQGRDGSRRDTYLVTKVDGEETERELISQEVVEEPVSKVVLVGTYQPPAPAARSTSSSSSSGGGNSVWDRLAQCESNGRWNANTGNGYYGGLQFHPATWRSVGGTGLPHEHSRATQIEMGKRLQARSGWGQWPACSRRLGLR